MRSMNGSDLCLRKKIEESESMESQYEEVKNEVDFLRLENSVYRRYLEKKKAETIVDEEEKKKAKSLKKKTYPTVLTSDQKYEISCAINESIYTELEKGKKEAEGKIDSLKAIVEETEIRIGELKREAYEFKRDVVVGAENPRTGQIMAEKVVKYFEDELKSKDVIIEKLKLKNNNLKSQAYKIEQQLSAKDDTSDSLHYIDFHQLQIENKQFLSKIEERNQELLSMKLTTGKTIVSLNDHKKQLLEEVGEFQALNNEVVEKKNLLERSIDECRKVHAFIKVSKRKSNKLRQEVEDSAAMEMPNIEDYVTQKKEMYELESKLTTWQKKVEILEMAAKRSRSQLRAICFEGR